MNFVLQRIYMAVKCASRSLKNVFEAFLYGNMKTANCCFPTGITAYDHEPLFTADMLVYGGRYYLIGEGHKEFAPDKIKDEDYYVLTLAAIAKELKAENLTEAHIVIAAGLPLTWTSGQKAAYKKRRTKNGKRA